MGIDDRIFTNGKISKILLRFAIPSIIALLVSELYNLVDTIFVGRYVSANAIGALTVAFPIQRLLTSLAMLVAVGTSTLVSRSLGEKNYDNLKESILNALSLTIIIISIVSIIIFIFKKPIIIKLGASEVIYPLVNKYVTIILIGAIFQCLSIVASYIMTALGKTQVSMYGNLSGVIANTIIDYILVAKFGFGIEGAAIATVISQILCFGYVFYKFSEVKKTFNIKLGISLNLKLIATISTIGFSTFIIEISDAVDAAVLNNILYSSGGDSAVIIVGVVTKLSMFMYVTIVGISAAMQPIIAYNYGARNYKRMKETLKVSIITVIIASLGFWVVFMVFANPMIRFFLKDEIIVPQAVSVFRICILLLPSVSVYYVTLFYYQAIGESKESFILSIYRELIIFIPTAILLVLALGVKGAWIAYPTTDFIAFATSIYFIRNAIVDLDDNIEKKVALKKQMV